jgi:hypothetical protein
MTALIANYKPQKDAFRALMQDGCRERILMFRGASGSGKTLLVNACLEELPEKARNMHFNCKDSEVNTAEVFYRGGDTLGWELLPCFIEQVAALSGATRVEIEHNRFMGIGNQINVALKAESVVDRNERRAALTSAWFVDLRKLESLMLVSIDTFEQATTEFKEWINGPFLYRAAQAEALRVLIAGQQTPDRHEHEVEWGRCCRTYELYGVREAQHWLPVVHALGRVVPAADPFSFMQGICHALKGKPGDIMNLIEGFPRREEAQ